MLNVTDKHLVWQAIRTISYFVIGFGIGVVMMTMLAGCAVKVCGGDLDDPAKKCYQIGAGQADE